MEFDMIIDLGLVAGLAKDGTKQPLVQVHTLGEHCWE